MFAWIVQQTPQGRGKLKLFEGLWESFSVKSKKPRVSQAWLVNLCPTWIQFSLFCPKRTNGRGLPRTLDGHQGHPVHDMHCWQTLLEDAKIKAWLFYLFINRVMKSLTFIFFLLRHAKSLQIVPCWPKSDAILLRRKLFNTLFLIWTCFFFHLASKYSCKMKSRYYRLMLRHHEDGMRRNGLNWCQI